MLKKLLIFIGVVALVYVFLNPYYLFPDGQGYFAYLPSLHFDNDLLFFNDFTNMRMPLPLAQTKSGYIVNYWPFGTAFFWTPFYLIGKAFAPGGASQSQYSSWYWFWVNFGTIVYGIFAYCLLVLSLKHLKKGGGYLIATLAFLGTPMFFYTFTISSTSHAVSAFVVALFVWYWIISISNFKKDSRYILLGLFLGLAAMVRQQESLFGLILITELFLRAPKELGLKERIRYLFLFAFFFLIAFSPQLLVWKIINGSFFHTAEKFNLSLKYFDLKDVLFSPYHGILFWTPVYFVALLGILLKAIKDPRIYLGVLLALSAQLLLNSCCLTYWEGYSFGLRQMTSSLAVVALGLYWFKDYLGKKREQLSWFIITVPCLWTTGLLINYYLGLDLLGFVSIKQLLSAQTRTVAGAIDFFKHIVSNQKVDLSSFILFFLAGGLCVFLANNIRRFLEGKKQIAIAILICCAIFSYNIKLISAYFNKPDTRNIAYKFITPEELDDYLVAQVNEIKAKYGIR
jgi:hypothetical protein